MNADINECMLWRGQETLRIIQVVQHVLLREFVPRHLSGNIFIRGISDPEQKTTLNQKIYFCLVFSGFHTSCVFPVSCLSV